MGCHTLDIFLKYCVYGHTDVFGCALIRTGCLQTGERYREGERKTNFTHFYQQILKN